MRASEWRVLALRLWMWDMIGYWQVHLAPHERDTQDSGEICAVWAGGGHAGGMAACGQADGRRVP
jgi:hypothetical protein